MCNKLFGNPFTKLSASFYAEKLTFACLISHGRGNQLIQQYYGNYYSNIDACACGMYKVIYVCICALTSIQAAYQN